MARASSAGVDVLLVLFDAAHEPQLEDEGWMRRVAKEAPVKCVFALNKCDRSPFYETMFRDLWREVAAERVAAAPEGAPPPPDPVWVKTCGIRQNGCDTLMDALFNLAEPGPALFPDDIVTDYPRKLAIADVIREKLLQRLHDEVPHEIGVVVADIDERRRSAWDVAATIYVNRPSQKGIVIGPGGGLIKGVRMSAEPELSDIFGVRVRLELWVKVVPNWMKNNRILAEMGYLGSRQ
jgi:GTP-binding protein Era